ncbi:MAG TPA: DUF2249 domain-containing protein [Burkholderiaceae bacterium]|nr:DUF2249 domain-containing protein [Burkholderiaceae bacterium]
MTIDCGRHGDDAPIERPHWAGGFPVDDAPRLDVRAQIAAGEEPLPRILQFVETVDADGAGDFVLIAPFDPQPLRWLLATRGFEAWPQQLDEGHWRVLFHRAGSDRGH